MNLKAAKLNLKRTKKMRDASMTNIIEKDKAFDPKRKLAIHITFLHVFVNLNMKIYAKQYYII